MSEPEHDTTAKPAKVVAGVKMRGAEKMARIPIKIVPTEQSEYLRKPSWIRAEFTGTAEVARVKSILRENRLHTVCEEARCPNLGECFRSGTATFMIMGDICTRRCPLDTEEPANLARTVSAMGLHYVVVTSVDRDDLRDGGADHFAQCIRTIREATPTTKIEILTPDFRGRMDVALPILQADAPDVFNHNLETVPRLYKEARPGADYHYSLTLLERFGKDNPDVPTKSGLMLGLGETLDEIREVLRDLRAHGVTMLTLGQYLQPSKHHLPVKRYVPPEEFDILRRDAEAMGFEQVASGPMVRSSYHADLQASGHFKI